MITGSVFRHFSSVTLSTADERHYTRTMNALTSAAFALFGIPHLGFRARAKIILKHLSKIPRTAKVLDAGCGYGIYSMFLSQRGVRVDAIDLDASRVAEIEKHKAEYPPLKNITTFVGSLTKLPYSSNSYDAIVCSDVVEHIADENAAFSELARVLKPKGMLIFSVPYNSQNSRKVYKNFGHERPGYTKEDIEKLGIANGLQLQSVRCYEYSFGHKLFNIHSKISSPALLALLFYPFYVLYLLDFYLKIGEPIGIVTTLTK